MKEEVAYWENLANRSNKLRDRERAQAMLEFLQPINNEIISLGTLTFFLQHYLLDHTFSPR